MRKTCLFLAESKIKKQERPAYRIDKSNHEISSRAKRERAFKLRLSLELDCPRPAATSERRQCH